MGAVGFGPHGISSDFRILPQPSTNFSPDSPTVYSQHVLQEKVKLLDIPSWVGQAMTDTR